jgi:hypothetical protein
VARAAGLGTLTKVGRGAARDAPRGSGARLVTRARLRFWPCPT